MLLFIHLRAQVLQLHLTASTQPQSDLIHLHRHHVITFRMNRCEAGGGVVVLTRCSFLGTRSQCSVVCCLHSDL